MNHPVDPRAWESSRRRFLQLAGIAGLTAAVGGGAAACGTAKTGSDTGAATGRAGQSGETFFVAGFQWGPPTNFNPLAPSPAWPTGGGQSQLIYESLLRFNLVDGSLKPGLGKELVEKDATTLSVTLQDGTTWSDGSPLTSADVVFTYQLAKDNELSFSSVWNYLESVTAVDERTVEFKCKANTLPVRASIGGQYILPKAVWEKIDGGKLQSETNLAPVGSGPYVVDKYDQTQIQLKKAEKYWGEAVYGVPAINFVNHPIFKSNSDGDLKLETGEIDGSQQFTAQIWKMWEDKKKPVGTWLKDKPYYLPGNIPLLIINTKKDGLTNKLVRKAIAYSIDYANIAETAMSSYSDPAKASLIIPTGYEETFFDQAAVDSNGWTFDADKAVQVLEEELKATKGSDGIYKLPDGTRLGPWTAICPTGWTDWNTTLEIVAKSAQAVGIDIKTEFPQAAQWTEKIQSGNFDLAMNGASGVSPASPWARFRDLMDDRGLGKQAFFNWGRFSHPDVPALLDAAGEATDDAARKEAYQKLDAIFRENVPVVPLMYRPLEFYEFNESNWTGFPTSENPFAPPQWSGAGIEWFFKLKKIGS